MSRRSWVLLATLAATGCSGGGGGDPVRVTVPSGASFSQVVDSLAGKEIVRAPGLFRIYGRVVGAAGDVKPGTYEFRAGSGWRPVLEKLRAGAVVRTRLVVPEGWDLRRIAPRLAALTEEDPDSVLAALADTAAPTRWGVPGPTMEGYLYPATYELPVRAGWEQVVDRMVERYREVWTPARRARADSMGMDERQVVTLASIIEREAKLPQEMPFMAAVYHNRLRIGMALQADPTVQYAIGAHQERLLYAHIDSVADNPYNTYTHPGLPPGPIASPSERAIDAVLHPADARFLYFVATPEGAHVFTRSLAEHNRVRAALRRAAREAGTR